MTIEIPTLREVEAIYRDAITAPDKRSKQVNIGASEVLENLFLERVRITDYCWIWTSTLTREGYGVQTYKGRQLRAHRLAWEIF